MCVRVCSFVRACVLMFSMLWFQFLVVIVTVVSHSYQCVYVCVPLYARVFVRNADLVCSGFLWFEFLVVIVIVRIVFRLRCLKVISNLCVRSTPLRNSMCVCVCVWGGGDHEITLWSRGSLRVTLQNTRCLHDQHLQRWGNCWEQGWSTYGLFRAPRHHLVLNWTEPNSVACRDSGYTTDVDSRIHWAACLLKVLTNLWSHLPDFSGCFISYRAFARVCNRNRMVSWWTWQQSTLVAWAMHCPN